MQNTYSIPLPLPANKDNPQATEFIRLALGNPMNRTVLQRMGELALQDCWLTSGCLVNTVWNCLTGRPATDGISDYDIFYCDPDTGWEAENAVIGHAERLFGDLNIRIQIRNQLRVPLWYPSRFGIPYPPLTGSCEAIGRFPCRASAIGLRLDEHGFVEICAPFGLQECLDMEIKPNRILNIPAVYRVKTERWKSNWPELEITPWHQEAEGIRN